MAHVKALPDNRYDGHTLGVVLPKMERQIGATIKRVVATAAIAAIMPRKRSSSE